MQFPKTASQWLVFSRARSELLLLLYFVFFRLGGNLLRPLNSFMALLARIITQLTVSDFSTFYSLFWPPARDPKQVSPRLSSDSNRPFE